MKTSFKKVFACFMALVMVLTVTPFTAVTAFAGEARSSNVEATEAKYKTAPSSTFTAKKGMSEVSWLNSGEVTLTDGTIYKQAFAPSSNVLYWPSAYVGTVTNLDESANRLNFKMFYPSAVLLWDGSTDVYMPIMALAQNTLKSNPLAFDSGRTIFYAAPYDNERVNNATSPTHSSDFYADEWRGIQGSNNENFAKTRFAEGSEFGFSANVLDSFIYTGEGAGKCYNFGLNWENDSASFLHVDKGVNFNSDGYLAKKLYWTTNSYNDPKEFNTAKDNNSWQSSSTVYVVDYSPIVEAAKQAADDLKDLVQTDYTPEAINAYYDAVQALYDFDPNTYFDQNDNKAETDTEDIALRVGKCTTEIKKLVNNYETAVQNVENNRQYRISFTDVNGNLLADHYYKAGETIIQPSLNSDRFVNTDPEGHYTVTYKWDPEVSTTAGRDIDYVEQEVIPVKTPHTYSDYTPVYQGGQYAHTRKCSDVNCGYTDWEYCSFVKDDSKSVDATCTADEILVKKCPVCGQSYTDTTNNTKKLGHDMQLVKTVAPTCNDEGYDLYKCSRCDVTEKRNTVPAIAGNHDYSFVKKVAPTCTEPGYDLYVCSKCASEEKRNIVPAPGHSFTNYVSDNNATCTADGTKTAMCDNCDATSTITDVGSKKPHTYVDIVTAPTCTQQGYTTHRCSNCSYTYKDSYVSKLNHSFTNYVSDNNATCTADGTKTAKCDRCDATNTIADVGSKRGHSFTNYVSDNNATCTEDGTKTAKCDRCDVTKTIADVGSKRGHNYVVSSTSGATCTEGGTIVYKCTRCDDTYTDPNGSALGHSFTNYVSDDNATCTADGTMTAKCDRCDVTNTITAPNSKLGHSFTNYVSDNNATCTADGTKTAKCDRCDATNTIADVGSKLDHSFTNYVSDNNASCTADGTKTAKCDRCDATNTIADVGSKLGHNYTTVVTAPTYESYGYTTYTCTRCGESYQADFTDKLVKPADPTPTPTPSPAPVDPTPSTPILSDKENKIANDYGVDPVTAQQIYYILIQNNVSNDTASLTEKTMTGTPVKGDGDYKGSNFGLLRAQTSKLTKNSVTVKWNKVKNADGYIVYGAKCGAKSKYKVLKVVSNKTTSYTHKKLKKGTYYKYNIVAFKYVNGTKVTLAASKKVHATTQGGKYGVAKSVKVNKSKVTIKKGKTFKIKASEVKKDKPIKKHRNLCYESSNTKVATVDSKGKIKAKKKGKCTIYIYAQNGVYKTVNVTVK